MDKNKGKKKTSKSGTKNTKKKTTTKKTEKTSKKKKTTKKSELEESPENDNKDIEVIEQKEKNEEGEDVVYLKEKLNQPLNKKKLPPIENNNEVQLVEKEKEDSKEINEEEKKEEENIEKEEQILKTESSAGTPFFYDISGLKTDLEKQNKKINDENIAQEKYKTSLNNLLNDLNKILSENVEYLYDEGDDPIKKQKQIKINNLQNILYSYQSRVKDAKEKNKTYKQHYELLLKQDETRVVQSAKEYEALIEEKKNDNNNLNKKISELKQTSQIRRKKLETYSENVKYPQDINNLSNQLKTLLKKKADYFSKLNKDIKTISTCQKELEVLEKFYEDKKTKQNFINPKIEEDIKRLKDDLTGNESEIYNKVQNDQAFIIRKQIHQEKVNSVFKIPSSKPQQKMKLKKGNNLEPLTMKAIRYDVRSGYNSRRMNIVAKNKSPKQNTYDKGEPSSNNILEEEDLSKVNYNNLTDFEYQELLTKKEHSYDVISRLEKSIKEAMKMYSRKIKDIKITLTANSKKLTERQQENTELETQIEELKKILTLTENEIKRNNMNNIYNNKINEKINTNNNIGEKELDSQKEYLSPDYYQSNKNKKNLEKKILSNNDLTGNELLNDLKGINADQTGPLLSGQGGQKMSNINMKFPDLSNIEEDKGDKNIVINNEFDRSKAIDDIKRKYNIKKTNIEENNDIDLDENELNFEDKNINKKKEEENIDDINDEKNFFKENENMLKNEEIGQYEPPIDNEPEIENNEEKKEIKDLNDNNNININEQLNINDNQNEKEKEIINNESKYMNYINRNNGKKEKEENIVKTEIKKEENNIEENKENKEKIENINNRYEEEDNKEEIDNEKKEELKINDDNINPERQEDIIIQKENNEQKEEKEEIVDNQENQEINNEIKDENEEKKEEQKEENLENRNEIQKEEINVENIDINKKEEENLLNENENKENNGEEKKEDNENNDIEKEKEEEKKEEIENQNVENIEEKNEEKKEETEENKEINIEKKEEAEDNINREEENIEKQEENIEKKEELVNDNENKEEKIEEKKEEKIKENKEEKNIEENNEEKKEEKKEEENKNEDDELNVEDLQI